MRSVGVVAVALAGMAVGLAGGYLLGSERADREPRRTVTAAAA
jgi:hypothetical protein